MTRATRVAGDLGARRATAGRWRLVVTQVTAGGWLLAARVSCACVRVSVGPVVAGDARAAGLAAAPTSLL